MMSKVVKTLVISGLGINCEAETEAGFKLAGSLVQTVHLNKIIAGSVDIFDFDIIVFPGGFSFGDDIHAAKVLANRIKFKRLKQGETLFEQLKRFVERGGFILGICNGFQVLVKLGFLPNVSGKYEQEVTLAPNTSGRFEDRWVCVKVNSNSPIKFLNSEKILFFPVRHAEGRVIIKNEHIKREILRKGLNVFSYCDGRGNVVKSDDYPYNPNGSELSIAGLSDPRGKILGMMPHPEAYLSFYNNPHWGMLGSHREEEEPHGLLFLKNFVEYVASQKKD